MKKWKTGGIVFALLAGITIGFPGCYFDNEEDLYPKPPCDTTNITYSQTIAPIISLRCYDCHSNATSQLSGSGISWEGHPNIDSYLDDFSAVFIGVINHADGFVPMPKDRPKLSECEIRQIEIWIENGHPNN
jgi:hypothetical protein